MLEWPRRACTERKSAPFSKRSVANEWRMMCGVTLRVMPAFTAYCFTVRSTERGVRRISLAFFEFLAKKNPGSLRRTQVSRYNPGLTLTLRVPLSYELDRCGGTFLVQIIRPPDDPVSPLANTLCVRTKVTSAIHPIKPRSTANPQSWSVTNCKMKLPAKNPIPTQIADLRIVISTPFFWYLFCGLSRS